MTSGPIDDIQSLLAGASIIDEKPTAPQPVPGSRPRGRPRKDGTPPGSMRADPEVAKNEIPMPKAGVIAEGVSGLYAFAGMALMPMGRVQTAQALMANADDIGKAWEAAAAANPQIRKMLMALMGTSTIGLLVMVHVPIIMVAVGESKDISARKREERDATESERTESTISPHPPTTA